MQLFDDVNQIPKLVFWNSTTNKLHSRQMLMLLKQFSMDFIE